MRVRWHVVVTLCDFELFFKKYLPMHLAAPGLSCSRVRSSSLTRAGTSGPTIGNSGPSHWTTRESQILLLCCCFHVPCLIGHVLVENKDHMPVGSRGEETVLSSSRRGFCSETVGQAGGIS